MRLISELKRRGVLRIAALYLGSGWLVMQVVDILIDRGPLPESLGPQMLLLLLIGFPIALILSWFYEITPEGVTLDENVTAGATAPSGGQRLNFVIIAVLAAAVLMFAFDKWWTGPPPRRSVAVLPFVNVSADNEDEYLAVGVADTTLNVLVTIPDLHVASRTSSFQPRLQGLSTPEVAAILGVTTVLEGSVQRQGDRLRITAQLVDAENDSHLWSQNFDRDYGDLFAVQDEIAVAVASALQIAIGDDVRRRIDREGTDNLQAFEEYAKAIENLRVRTFDSVSEAAAQLERAVELDPDYARAHATLGLVYTDSRFAVQFEPTNEERRSRARDAATTALRIAPGLSTALTVLGNVTEDIEVKGQIYREAVTNGPNDTHALQAYTHHLFIKEHKIAEAMGLSQKLIRLDPLDEKNYWHLAHQQLLQTNVADALTTIAIGKEKLPESVELRDLEAFCYHAIGDRSSAIVVKYETLAIDPKDFLNRLVIATDYLALDMPDEADRWFERAAETAPESERDYLLLVRRTLLGIHSQRDDAAVFESLQRWVTEPGHWGFPDFNPLITFVEYGERLGRIDEVQNAVKGGYPHLFVDPPDMDKDVVDTFAVGLILLRVGDRRRGEPLVRRGLKLLEKIAASGGGKDPASVYALYSLGDTDGALSKFRSLDFRGKAYLSGFGWQFLLQHSPVIDPIRDEPEFVTLMKDLDGQAALQRKQLVEMAGELSVR